MAEMTMTPPVCRRLLFAFLATSLAACAGASGTTQPVPSVANGLPTSSASVVPSEGSAPGEPASQSIAPAESQQPVGSQAPDTAGGTTSGDVPDNAVFLTYRQASLGFAVQYVEGWQVSTKPEGVLIRDKDSSETVSAVALPSDVAAYIASTDLPALQSQAGYKFVKQDTVKVGDATYAHVVYHILSAVDPVTNKQVPSTVDRYYVPGPTRLAIVSLSTPDGVDNVDAFRQMIESFTWG
jgi:hypothetical protein